MENNYGMLIIWLFPLISGVIAFYLGKKNQSTRNDWVDIVMFVEWILLGCMAYMLVTDWNPMSLSLNNVFGLGLVFEIDKVRLVFCTVITTIFTVVSQFMKESLKEERGSNRFYLLYMGVYSMLMAAVMTPNVLNLVLFMTLALLLLYPMIIHRQRRVAVKNAGIYLVFVVITLVLFIVSLVLIVGNIGVVEFDAMYVAFVMNETTTPAIVGTALLFVIFAIYAGIFPVQFLITRGASNGVMEGTVLVSGAVSKVGMYGMIILACTLFNSNKTFGEILLVLAILTMIWGLGGAFLSTDVRRILVGMDIAVNGFGTLGIALIPFVKEASAYTIRGSIYMLLSSALSLVVLYMSALELVRKGDTFEIKGLIATGKGKKLLMTGSFIACANLLGLPGTMGYLGYSAIFKNIIANLGWKWLIGLFVVLWAFLMAAVSRVFMKFFVSKKDETVLILSTAEEINGSSDVQKDTETTQEDENPGNEEASAAQKKPYAFGEVLLLLIGILLVAVGIAPKYTIGRLAEDMDQFFWIINGVENYEYYTVEGLVAFIVAALLAVILYVNLVHGILLRAVRNKKNKELKEWNDRTK